MTHTFNRLFTVALPLTAALAGLAGGALALSLTGYELSQTVQALGSRAALTDILLAATPLLFVALGVGTALQAGLLNVGGGGQMSVGALCAWLFGLSFPTGAAWFIVPVALLLGCLGGALWGALAGYWRVRFQVSEVLSTFVLNLVALHLLTFLLRAPGGTRLATESTLRPAQAFALPHLGATRLHAGVPVALVTALLVYALLRRTSPGYRFRAVGLNAEASRYAGIAVERTRVWALALSGGLCGLAGAVQVYALRYRLPAGDVAGFSEVTGFVGLSAALLAGSHPLGAVPAALFFGALLVSVQALTGGSSFVLLVSGLSAAAALGSRVGRRKWSERRFPRDAQKP